MKGFIILVFISVLCCHGQNCTTGQKWSNGHCCNETQYYNTSASSCQDCKCNEFGAKGGKKGGCDEKGDCYCYVDYTGGKCGSCVNGATRFRNGHCDDGCQSGQKRSNGHCCLLDHFFSTQTNKCQYCTCNEFGAKGGKKGGCDEKGYCYCYDEYNDGECGSCVNGATRLRNGRCDDGCQSGQKRSNGHCCLLDHYFSTQTNKCQSISLLSFNCKCNEFGAKGGKKGGCDEKGDCYCYDDYTGGKCGSCVNGATRFRNGHCDDGCQSGQKRSNGHCCLLDHFFSTQTNKCQYCRCNEFGAKGGKKGRCDEKGDCYCYDDYTDGKCGSCIKGATRLKNGRCDDGCQSGQKRTNGYCCLLDHYFSTRTNKCRYCRCNEFGAKGGKKGGCDEKGDCYCYDDYTNGKCESCVNGATRWKNGRCDYGCPSGQKRSNTICCKLDHYFSTQTNKCQDCKCDEIGAKGGKKGQCDEDGNCFCYDLYDGSQCQKCKSNGRKSSRRCCKKGQYYSFRYKKCRTKQQQRKKRCPSLGYARIPRPWRGYSVTKISGYFPNTRIMRCRKSCEISVKCKTWLYEIKTHHCRRSILTYKRTYISLKYRSGEKCRRTG